MNDEIEIFIQPDGTLRFIYSDEIAEATRDLGKHHTQRASHVEPDTDGNWTVDMSPIAGRPMNLGAHAKRSDAINAEVNWLREYLTVSEHTSRSQS